MTTDPATTDAIAVRFVREEMANLRASMREDTLSLRASVDSLATELRATIGAWAPRLAVLERRADDANTELAELRTAAARVTDLERKSTGYERDIATLTERLATAARTRTTLIVTLTVGTIVAVIAAVLAWALPG